MAIENEKVSIAKLMDKQGTWGGPAAGESYYGLPPHEAPTGAGLVVDENKWPSIFIKPEVLRPHTSDGSIDKGGVVENGFKPESVETHIPIVYIESTTSGTENEFRLLDIPVSQEMHDNAKAACQSGPGGYTTSEVASDMIEANRPIVRTTTFSNLTHSIEKHTTAVIRTVEEMGGRVIMTSSRPNTNSTATAAPDKYVDAMVDLLAKGYLNTQSPEILAWMAYTSETMLDGLSPEEIAQKVNTDHEFARRGVVEFDASAIHAHAKVTHQEPNPHFYGFHMNHEMGVIGPALSVHTLSGPFRNGKYCRLHDNKLIHRLWFRTAGYQPSFYPMGSPEYLEEAAKNTSHGAASSLTRAGITGDRSHGEGRIRTERTILTDERLFGSAHPLAEVEAAFAYTGNVNMAILSHYYEGNGDGTIPDHAKPYYDEPKEHRYHINRLQFAAHGPFATMIDGTGKAVTYRDFITGYRDFLDQEVDRLGIVVNREDFTTYLDWLGRPVEVPEGGWSIKNYNDKDHSDYGKGTLATHMIAELVVKESGDERWRNSYQTENGEWKGISSYEDACEWWTAVVHALPEGDYEDHIAEVIDDFADAVHNRYIS